MTKFTLNTLAAAVLVATSGAASAAALTAESVFFTADNNNLDARSSIVINLGETTDDFRADPLGFRELSGAALATLNTWLTQNAASLNTIRWNVFGRSNDDPNIAGNLEFGGLTTMGGGQLAAVDACLANPGTSCGNNTGATRINSTHTTVQNFQNTVNPNLQSTDAFFAPNAFQSFFASQNAGVTYQAQGGVGDIMPFFSFSPQQGVSSAVANARGQVAGPLNGALPGWKLSFDNGQAALTYSVVPVPAAVWMLGSALVGLVGVSRRKA